MPLGSILPRLKAGEFACAVEPRRRGDGWQGRQSRDGQSEFPGEQSPGRREPRRCIRRFGYRHAKRSFANALHVAGDHQHAQQIQSGERSRLHQQSAAGYSNLVIKDPHWDEAKHERCGPGVIAPCLARECGLKEHESAFQRFERVQPNAAWACRPGAPGLRPGLSYRGFTHAFARRAARKRHYLS